MPVERLSGSVDQADGAWDQACEQPHRRISERKGDLVNIPVSYHDSVNKLQEFAEFARGPFDRFEWYDLLEKQGYPAQVWISDGENPAALPLMRKNGGLVSLANWFNFTWRPLGKDREAMTAIAHELRSEAHHVALAPLPDEHGEATLLEQAFRSAGWIVRREQSDENHVLSVDGRTFAEYWNGRPGRMRTTLKRKAKKVEVSIQTEFDDALWSAYQQVYQNSWKPEEEEHALLKAFAQIEAELGHLRIGLAHHEGAPVAAQFWTVENGTAYIHKLAHIERAKALSAGTTLSAALFEHAIDVDNVEMIDFGTGNDPYKRDWMKEVRPRYRLSCMNPSRPKAWPAIAKHGLRVLASP